jgi:hypothetical protein
MPSNLRLLSLHKIRRHSYETRKGRGRRTLELGKERICLIGCMTAFSRFMWKRQGIIVRDLDLLGNNYTQGRQAGFRKRRICGPQLLAAGLHIQAVAPRLCNRHSTYLLHLAIAHIPKTKNKFFFFGQCFIQITMTRNNHVFYI